METKKYCALTFDDGPDVEKTPLVLEKLERYNVKATFMQVGNRINESTLPVIKRIIADNCEIGNHSWAMESLDSKSPEEIRKSIADTTKAIEKASGTTPRFFRPPNLACNEKLIREAGLPCVSGIIAMDWQGCNTDAQQRADNVLKNIKDGAIILMHDAQPAPHPTPEALDIIIPELQKQGYEFLTLTELFKVKNIDPKSKNEMWVFVE